MLVYVAVGYLLGREETYTTLTEVFRVFGACIKYLKSGCQPKPTKRAVPSLSETLEAAKPKHWRSHEVCEDECDCEEAVSDAAPTDSEVAADVPTEGPADEAGVPEIAPAAIDSAVPYEELKKDL